MSCISKINRPNCKNYLTYCPFCVIDTEYKRDASPVVNFAKSWSIPFLSISLLLYRITLLLGSAWTFFYKILLCHFFCSISASLILQMPHKDRPNGQFCTVRFLFISFSNFSFDRFECIVHISKKDLHLKMSSSRIRLFLRQNFVWTVLFAQYLYP